MSPDFKQLDNFFTNSPQKNGRQPASPSKRFLPTKEQFYYLPRVLSPRERYIITALVIVALASLIAIPISAYYHGTVEGPQYGGSWSEGMIGTPQHINPLLLQANDVDSDLVNLMYAGLLRYDGNGNLVPDLAESYTISDNGLEYSFKLKENLRWHDGRPLTVDDVLFTILTAQNSDYGSTQRINWQGVDVSKREDRIVVFTLKNRYAQFIDNATLSILPKHIWENVKPANFASSEHNLKPIGSGPYKFSKLRRDTLGTVRSITLVSFDQYAGGKPFIDQIDLSFYESEQKAIDAYNGGEVGGLSFVSAQRLQDLKSTRGITIHQLRLPRYFAVFFNQNKSKVLSDKNARLALNHATNKAALVEKLLADKATVVHSPLLPGIIDIPEATATYPYDLDKAKKLLQNVKEPLDIEITTSSWPELAAVAEELKTQWEVAGFRVTIRMLSVPEVQQAIKDRDYASLLFGEVLGLNPDPFSFWHSSQKRDPGLNLALYDNRDADKILEDARQVMDDNQRREQYNRLQNIINGDVPIVMLYSPDYLYIQPNDIKNNTASIIAVPAYRFDTVHEWYIDTQRKKE
ncbi:MAG: ABC transporter substrate-binding protein [Patescibacteria group bacterium]